MFELELEWDRPAHSSSRPSLHTLRVRIRPQTLPVEKQGMPLRLALALDTSSSMAGTRLAHAKEACLTVLAQLRPEDQFSLAGFAGEIRPLLHQVAGGPSARENGDRVLAGLQALGVTRTDLALDWLQEALPPELGTMRMGILVTDGHPTDLQGQPLPATTDLLEKAAHLGASGRMLSTVGLGDAANFNTAFLVDLSDRGRGGFLYADTPDALEPQLRTRLAVGQSISAADVRLILQPLLPGVLLKSGCRLRPDFVPLEFSSATDTKDQTPSAEYSLRLGGLQGDVCTDVLVSVEAPSAAFGDPSSSRLVLAVRLETEGTTLASEATAALDFTNSYAESQRLDPEVNQDRLQWELNIYSQALNRNANVQQTATLLGDIAHVARKAGREALAIKVTGQLAELEKRGRLDAHRATGLLVETRQPLRQPERDDS